ncbi:MAG: hypothetical protein QGH76_09425 [Phycisphaerales bacterium]|nr:hypothetical protein [Phycisphaerales bacterium]
MIRTVAMCVVGVCLGTSGGGAQATPAVDSGGLAPTLECCFARDGLSYNACVMPPTVCPNGAFTEVGACAAVRATQGCPGTSQDRTTWTGEYTGLRIGQLPCAAMGQFYNTMRCRCSGNIFGWCTGPCTPTGGVADALVPCPGTVMALIRCEDEG